MTRLTIYSVVKPMTTDWMTAQWNTSCCWAWSLFSDSADFAAICRSVYRSIDFYYSSDAIYPSNQELCGKFRIFSFALRNRVTVWPQSFTFCFYAPQALKKTVFGIAEILTIRWWIPLSNCRKKFVGCSVNWKRLEIKWLSLITLLANLLNWLAKMLPSASKHQLSLGLCVVSLQKDIFWPDFVQTFQRCCHSFSVIWPPSIGRSRSLACCLELGSSSSRIIQFFSLNQFSSIAIDKLGQCLAIQKLSNVEWRWAPESVSSFKWCHQSHSTSTDRQSGKNLIKSHCNI